jgi:hypothetical protein
VRLGEAVVIEKVRHIGFGLAAKLLIAVTLVGYSGLAATAGDASRFASAMQKIFADFDAQGVDIAFGGPIAAPLGIAQRGQTVEVHELPPFRTSSMDVVHVFERLKDGSGYIILRFTPSGFVALRFDKNFDFVAGAIQRYGQAAAALSGAAAEDALGQELRDCQTIAGNLTAHR